MIKVVIATIVRLDLLLSPLSGLAENDNVRKGSPAVPLGLLLQATLLPCSRIAPLKTKISLDAPFSLSSLIDRNQLISSPLCRNRSSTIPTGSSPSLVEVGWATSQYFGEATTVLVRGQCAFGAAEGARANVLVRDCSALPQSKCFVTSSALFG